eukprot:TRINITY_DN14601_c0_g1_i1.p1 TRINITY_DN14601_c0_g1~~TRINITY_DN14601_c0_g1_i1.p1  ORF type:complete len:174 (-),score=72.62 TRINITY_DN14601_c0_g1_i1:23-544(-)
MSQVIAVIGGGAAGLTSAHFASKAGGKVMVLERNKEAGKKILMSGGTRCNVLPFKMDLSKDYFSDSSKNSIKKVFHSWNLESCKDWMVNDLNLELEGEEETNKWFPKSNSAREVRDKLLRSVENGGANVVYDCLVTNLHKKGAKWNIEISSEGGEKKRKIEVDKVIISTGGLS